MSSFRTILIMIILMIIGGCVIPLLSVHYIPGKQEKSISISYSWHGASAKLIEQEVTSKIEGALAQVTGLGDIKSRSRKNYGSVHVAIKKNSDIDVIRFEISSKIRSIYKSFPEDVSYPYISMASTSDAKSIISYTLNSNLPTWDIQLYAEQNLQDKIAEIDGIDKVELHGATPNEWVITFDVVRCAQLGVVTSDIEQSLKVNGAEYTLGMIALIEGQPPVSVTLSDKRIEPDDWGYIEVKNINGHIVLLSEIATITKQEQLPRSYNRINGLNNVNIYIYPEQGVNSINLAKDIKDKVTMLDQNLPDNFDLMLIEDTTVYIKGELEKIYYRTGLSILILLLFVFLVSFSGRYLMMIIVTLIANILISFIFYVILGVDIHLYSLAGITVSLGIIIDTSIMVIDHYSRFKNLKILLAIIAALLTTIGALSIVYFLPDGQRENLVDFSVVMIINLIVSLLISVFFIPSLLDRFPLKIGLKRDDLRTKKRRIIARITAIYGLFIVWGRRHKWAFILLAIVGFGLPIHILPAEIGLDNNNKLLPDSLQNIWQKAYNNTIGSDLYQTDIKTYAEPILGGTLRPFMEEMTESYSSSTPERTQLYISAVMPEGHTIHQLNYTMIEMENFLSQFSEIDVFKTSINDPSYGLITVTLMPEAEKKGFAYVLKERITGKAIALGGAEWGVWGVGRGFSNRLYSGRKSNSITIAGYNYDKLYAIAEDLIDTISLSNRVKKPIISASSWEGTPVEFFLDFNFEYFSLYDINIQEYFVNLSRVLHRSNMTEYYNGKEYENVVLISSLVDDFDVWHLENDMIQLNNRDLKLSRLGTIDKRFMGNNIYKVNQEYSIAVSYDFMGGYKLQSIFEERQRERLKNTLPIGFSVIDNSGWGSWAKEMLPYKLLLIVIAIIFFICSVLFESVRQPFVIISLIPISFIGVFLTFWLLDLTFDQGGFASFVLLSGIVVNAGIYLTNEYNIMCQSGTKQGVSTYLRCFNRKIMPILLTIISTVLGLLPFVLISREPFWFSFASGAIGGVLFSILAIIIFLPIFLPLKRTIY